MLYEVPRSTKMKKSIKNSDSSGKNKYRLFIIFFLNL